MTKNQKVMEKKINKDMTIGEMAAKYPAAVGILIDEGIQCVGCGAAQYETIEEGLMGHGKSSEYITKVITKMNEVVNNPESQKEEKKSTFNVKNAKFTIEASAVKKIKEIMKEEKKEDHGLRVEVIPGGCSGYQYGLDFDHQKRPTDAVFEKDGVKVYIDSDSIEMINGSSIEYVDSLQGVGFKINNPSATKGYGREKSFS